MKYFNWLKPGIHIKRWICTGTIGILLVSIGISPYLYVLFKKDIGEMTSFYLLIFFVGISVVVFSVWKLIKSMLALIGVHNFREVLNNKMYEQYGLNKGCKIVVVGGGTGLSVILRGIKKMTTNITAIVTTTDDGGGSGILREDLGMLPPGDIRSCILALADTEEDMQELLQYRFEEGRLSGQSFGNLFIAALTGVHESFEKAIAKVHEILAVKGRVVPVTAEDIQLCAELDNGNIIMGESKIVKTVIDSNSKIKKVFLKPESPMPLDGTIDMIKDADIIILGPGSLYTSIIPNLLITGIKEAILESKAKKIYITNVMTQPGETDQYSVLDHLRAVHKYAGAEIVEYIIVNNEQMPEDILKKYKEDGAEPVTFNNKEARQLKRAGVQIIEGSYVDIKQGYIRHDADKIAETIMALYEE